MDPELIPATANFGAINLFENPDLIKVDERDSKYLLISSIYESNYTMFLDLDFLKQRYQTLNYIDDSASSDIQEICICCVSFLIESNELEEATLF